MNKSGRNGTGMSPAEAMVAATSRPAELMGQSDLGSLAVGKRASFVVLDANPAENVRNTRTIAAVYPDGAPLDRDGCHRPPGAQHAHRWLFTSTDFNSYVTTSIADGAPQRTDGRVAASLRPGLGIEPRLSALGSAVATYQ